MTRKTVRWVIGATAGLIASTGLANGTAQAGAVPDPVGALLPAAGVGQMLPIGAVTGILPVGK
ncbi:MAG TPA: hypothetical protein VIQ30_01760 [Pseudonocardia sp.]|jgi:hypothetical protein